MILRGAPPIFATSPSLMDAIPEGVGNFETDSPIAVSPVDGGGVVEGCPTSGAEVGAKVGVGVNVGYGPGGYVGYGTGGYVGYASGGCSNGYGSSCGILCCSSGSGEDVGYGSGFNINCSVSGVILTTETLDGCDSLDESESLDGINALQMAIPENSSTTIAVNTTIKLFFIFCLVTPYFFIPLFYSALPFALDVIYMRYLTLVRKT